jgi:hypothetical protein
MVAIVLPLRKRRRTEEPANEINSSVEATELSAALFAAASYHTELIVIFRRRSWKIYIKNVSSRKRMNCFHLNFHDSRSPLKFSLS